MATGGGLTTKQRAPEGAKGGSVKIEKDAEWLRLEGGVGQLRGDLRAAERRLELHAKALAEKQLGLVQGETVLVDRGERYVYMNINHAEWGWVNAAKIRKDGKPSEKTQRLSHWQKE